MRGMGSRSPASFSTHHQEVEEEIREVVQHGARADGGQLGGSETTDNGGINCRHHWVQQGGQQGRESQLCDLLVE
jgi:hypothetical protein